CRRGTGSADSTAGPHSRHAAEVAAAVGRTDCVVGVVPAACCTRDRGVLRGAAGKSGGMAVQGLGESMSGEAASGGLTEYIVHHLTHNTKQVAGAGFHVDSWLVA